MINNKYGNIAGEASLIMYLNNAPWAYAYVRVFLFDAISYVINENTPSLTLADVRNCRGDKTKREKRVFAGIFEGSYIICGNTYHANSI